jgi:hypothetical protein
MQKKSLILIFLLMAVAFSGPAMAELERAISGDIAAGASLNVTFIIKDAVINQKAVLGETMPEGATLLDWQVIGAVEPYRDIKFIQEGQKLTWEFNASRTSPTVFYGVKLPDNATIVKFDAVYAIPPDKFGYSTKTLNLQTANIINTITAKPSNKSGPNIFLIAAIVILALIVITTALLMQTHRQRTKKENLRDLHSIIKEARMIQNKAAIIDKYRDILTEYNRKTEMEKAQYFQEITELYNYIKNIK